MFSWEVKVEMTLKFPDQDRKSEVKDRKSEVEGWYMNLSHDYLYNSERKRWKIPTEKFRVLLGEGSVVSKYNVQLDEKWTVRRRSDLSTAARRP